MVRFALLALILPACIIEGHGDHFDDSCTGTDSLSIDTGADITHQAGVDAGYYLSYGTGGAWHLDWTCDTKLSSLGCDFSGTITVVGTTTATCFECEDADVLNIASRNGTTDISFDTATSTGLDGVDFTAAPGAAVTFDLQINGLYQPDLVFVPDGGVATPTCLPLSVLPVQP